MHTYIYIYIYIYIYAFSKVLGPHFLVFLGWNVLTCLTFPCFKHIFVWTSLLAIAVDQQKIKKRTQNGYALKNAFLAQNPTKAIYVYIYIWRLRFLDYALDRDWTLNRRGHCEKTLEKPLSSFLAKLFPDPRAQLLFVFWRDGPQNGTAEKVSLTPLNVYSGSEKGVFWKRGLFRKVHSLDFLETLEILEILENPQTMENKGESDHFLEIQNSREFRDSRDSRDSRDFFSGPLS